MTKKEVFIKEIKELLGEDFETLLSPAALDFWQTLTTFKEKPAFTENGKRILQYMQDQKEESDNIFKAKDIGNGLSILSRTVSGGLRKLVADGYVEKLGSNPIIYSITPKGDEVRFEAE